MPQHGSASPQLGPLHSQAAAGRLHPHPAAAGRLHPHPAAAGRLHPHPAAAGRLFLGVDPAPAAVADLDAALQPLRSAPGAPRWTPPTRWHLTLLFLGDIPAGAVEPLTAQVAPAVAAAPAVTLQLSGAGRFGSRRRPQVCWAGLAGDVGPLTELAGRLADAASAVGLSVEDRPFRAHLTLGRWRPGQPADGDLPERLAGYRGPEWPVTEVVLWRSHLGPTPRYDRLDGWPVG